MLVLAAAAAMIASPPTSVHEPYSARSVQAIASVRIISGAELSFHSPNRPEIPRMRDAVVTTPAGGRQPARLIEFE